MTEPVDVAVPRKGRPLEAVLASLAEHAPASDGHGHHGGDGGADGGPDVATVADDVASILRAEKAVTKGRQSADGTVYERLAAYSDLDDPFQPEFTLLRDDRPGRPRRVVFDSVRIPFGDRELRLLGREEPFRAVRTHEVPLAFDSADLVLEEVVDLRPEPLERIADLNARIDPMDTDVRVAAGLGDTVYHTLLGTPTTKQAGPTDALDRSFVADYEGELCISPRYERLVTAVLGTRATEDVDFCYPDEDREEEAAIADAGLGVYLTQSGSTAREHGLEVGQQLFPSETVLLENTVETDGDCEAVLSVFGRSETDTELTVAR